MRIEMSNTDSLGDSLIGRHEVAEPVDWRLSD